VQISSALPRTLTAASFGELRESYTNVASEVSSFSFLTSFWSRLDCDLTSDFCWRATALMLAFLSFGLSLPITFFALRPVLARRGWSQRRIDRFSNSAINFMLFILLGAHAPLSAMLLRMIVCRGFGPLEGTQQRYLEADLAIHCDSSHYYGSCVGVASAFILLYTLGIPAVLLYIAVKYQSPFADSRRKQLERAGKMTKEQVKHDKKKWEARAMFFTKKYEPSFWFYEVIDMFRRLSLTSFLIVLAPGTTAQPLAGVVLCLFFLLLHTRFCPLHLTSIDVLTFVSQLCILIMLLYAVADSTGVIYDWEISQGGILAFLLVLNTLPVALGVGIILHAVGALLKIIKFIIHHNPRNRVVMHRQQGGRLKVR